MTDVGRAREPASASLMRRLAGALPAGAAGLRFMALCFALFGWSAASHAQATDASKRLRPIVERVARGEDSESAEAAEELTDAVLGPLMQAIGSLERDLAAGRDRSPTEQMRLRTALARLTAELSMRTFELDLPEEDRKLLRQFARSNPDLTARLFSPRVSDRADAIGRIPLQANGPAGVLIGARVDDEDEDVAHAALDAALKLRDPVVARQMRRYVAGATQAIRGGAYGPQDQDVVRSLSIIVERALQVMAAAKDAESVPIAADAFRLFVKPEFWLAFECAHATQSLGELGDERLADVLLASVEDPRASEMRAVGAGQRVEQTVGDAALLSLLRVYGLDAKEFGFVEAGEESSRILGFSDAKIRAEAIQRFRVWHGQNTGRSRADRTPASPRAAASRPAASAPAGAPGGTP